MNKLLSFLFICMAFSLTSCQKQLDEEDIIFRGDWDSKTYAIEIHSNGYGICNTRKWGGLTCQGYVTIKSNKIVFTSNKDASTLPRKKFDIDEKPTTDANGITFMVLDGERFERR